MYDQNRDNMYEEERDKYELSGTGINMYKQEQG
jgi:hypothetical protein